MPVFFFFVVVIFIQGFSLITGRAEAQEGNRFALLIGNQAYDPSVGALSNPHNDIAVVGAALRRQGFEVLPEVKDARRSAILGAVRQFRDRLVSAGPGSVGFLYYSGHGAAEADTGINYIIPVDARDPGSAAFWDDSLKIEDIVKLLDAARSAAKFIVFDACRNELRVPAKSTIKGLVPVAEQHGMLIAYATAPGRTASDRGDKSGPFAAALASELEKPGLDHLNFFQNVKETVLISTSGVQQPWINDGLARRVLLTRAVDGDTGRLSSTGVQISEAALVWTSLMSSKDVKDLEAFRRQYGRSNPLYDRLAEKRIEELGGAATSGFAAAPKLQSPEASSSDPEFIQRVQAELVRVGCDTVAPDGTWSARSLAAASRFIKNTGLSLDARAPTVQLLNAIQARTGRVCPLICPRGQREENGRCVSQAATAKMGEPQSNSAATGPSQCVEWRNCLKYNTIQTTQWAVCGPAPLGC